jgi:flagellar basal-body rod modification protein FlgD
MIDQVSSSSESQVQSGTDSLVSQAIMAKDDFLKLIIAQMKNQDPLSPMESQEFASQLAQFTSVEQLANINSNLEKGVNLDLLLTQAINNTLSVATIGKQAKGYGDYVLINGDGKAHLSFDLESFAKDVTVTIRNEAGVEVRTLQLSNLSSGSHTISWDLQNDAGETMPDATYKFEISAIGSDDSAVKATGLMIGNVTGVRYEDSQAILLVDNQEVSFGNVLEIGSTNKQED